MDLEPQALRIAPVVTGRQYIVVKTAHPNAIFVQVPLRHDMIVPLYIAPEFKLPTTPTLTVDVPVRDGEAALTDHDWARNHAACLFWAVQRGPKPGAATRGHGDAVPAPNDAQVNDSFELVDVVTMPFRLCLRKSPSSRTHMPSHRAMSSTCHQQRQSRSCPHRAKRKHGSQI